MDWNEIWQTVVLYYNTWLSLPGADRCVHLLIILLSATLLMAIVWHKSYYKMKAERDKAAFERNMIETAHRRLCDDYNKKQWTPLEERAGNILLTPEPNEHIQADFLLDFIKQIQTGHSSAMEMVKSAYSDASGQLQNTADTLIAQMRAITEAAMSRLDSMAGKISNAHSNEMDVNEFVRNLTDESLKTIRHLSENNKEVISNMLDRPDKDEE